jgi:PAS domain S-box-containing protein
MAEDINPKSDLDLSRDSLESAISEKLRMLQKAIEKDKEQLNAVLAPMDKLRYRIGFIESALSSSQNLAAIVTYSDDAIISKDLGGKITSWNLGAQKIFGYTATEAIGQSIKIIIPPQKIDEESYILSEIIKGAKIRHYETDRVCKDGSLITVSISVSPIFDASGNVIGASKIARDITVEKEVQEKLRTLNARLQISLMETIGIARQLVELRDPYTAGHEMHVGDLAKAIGAEMGLDHHQQEGLMFAGYLHDIGKIIIPVEILSKPGQISPEEFNLVKNHVLAGWHLLNKVTFPWVIARPVLEHHERLDGSGYPNALIADQISLDGRILAVADVVDAMSSHRPYRPALGVESALAEIQRGRGTQYDAAVVDACITLFREKHYQIPDVKP